MKEIMQMRGDKKWMSCILLVWIQAFGYNQNWYQMIKAKLSHNTIKTRAESHQIINKAKSCYSSLLFN